MSERAARVLLWTAGAVDGAIVGGVVDRSWRGVLAGALIGAGVGWFLSLGPMLRL